MNLSIIAIQATYIFGELKFNKMGKFKSINLLNVYEIDGSETEFKDRPEFKISNHWNRKDFVNLEFNGKIITVLAEDLKRAINNAQAAHPY